MRFNQSDLNELLHAFPRLRPRPASQLGLAVVAGVIPFEASSCGKPTILDEYRIRLEVALTPTSSLPKVYEEGGRIPRKAENHVNPGGDLCLGSPLRLLSVAGPAPTLIEFVDRCVVPFLYAASWREQGRPGFPFDELAHGSHGLIADYERLFAMQGSSAVVGALLLLGRRKRVANKMQCSCGCGRRLVMCSTHARLAGFRTLASRSFYRSQASLIDGLNRSEALVPTKKVPSRRLEMHRLPNLPLLAARAGESSKSRLE